MPIYKDGDKWYFMVSYKDIYGNKKRYKSKRYDKNKKKNAIDDEALFRVKLKEPAKSNVTFENLYKEYYVYASSQLRERTLNINDGRIKLHVMPYFKNKRIDNVTTGDIIKWKDNLNNKTFEVKKGKEIEKRKYSLEYKNSIFTNFRSVLNYAIKFGKLDKNPLSLVGEFKDKEQIKKEMSFYTEKDILKLVDKEDNIVYKTLFLVLYYCGLRIGESQALNWKDYGNGKLKINKTLTTKIKGVDYKITAPKTVNSIREVYLSDFIISLLDELKNHYKQYKNYSDDWFIFGGIGPLPETSIRRHKNNACKNAGLKEIRIHDFRHSHASYLINLGADIVYISQRLGHKSIKETLDTYSHLFPSKQQEIVNLMNKSVPKVYQDTELQNKSLIK